MANDPDDKRLTDILSALSNPQFKELISLGVVLGLLLIFARDLADPSGFRNYLLGAVTVYLIGTLFLVQTQVNLISHARHQTGQSPEHFPSFQGSQTAKRHRRIACAVMWYEDIADTLGHVTIRFMPVLRGILLVLLISYLFWRRCL